MAFATMPYKIGLVTAIAGGLSSIPLVFHLDSAMWFNEHFGADPLFPLSISHLLPPPLAFPPACRPPCPALTSRFAAVTAEVAEPEDLETWLEVGAWTWNWMEPPLGQISFFLLTLQFARNQMLNLGAKPYTHWLQQFRAKRLERVYPQYNSKILADFAISDNWT